MPPSRPALAHHSCALYAPRAPEGNVYLLCAAGHQALLQPEGLLLGARLGVVVPHQAPLDLKMTDGVSGRGPGGLGWPLPFLSRPAQAATFCQTSSVRSGALR